VLARVPATSPHRIAPETWLIPNLAPAGPDVYVPANSMLIRAAEPVVVDTGAPVHRQGWLEQVFSLVEPDDVRWVFLSHDDGDHMGNLYELLELCPQATLVVNFFIHKRLILDRPLPLFRMRWVGPGESFDAGDRRLHLVVPPIFDGPTTRGLYDDRTGVLWAVDSFAALTPGAIHDVADVPKELFDETFPLLNSLTSPWHQWLDPVRYHRHVDAVEALGSTAVASAHGPVLTGPAIVDAFRRVRAMAGEPIMTPPGQPLLDDLVAAALQEMPDG
jgi:flavorubredoxin